MNFTVEAPYYVISETEHRSKSGMRAPCFVQNQGSVLCIHVNRKQLGSRLGMVTLVGYTSRFSVTHGYVNSQKRREINRLHLYVHNRVTDYANPWV